MPKTLILYGTLTGNTELAAKGLAQRLGAGALYNVRDISPTAVATYSHIIFGTSTWDDFGNPDTEDFLNKMAQDGPDLSYCRFAFFGLGDSAYQNFCGAVDLAKQGIGQRGGVLYPDTFTIDGYPEDDTMDSLAEWAHKFLETPLIERETKI